MSGVGEDQVGGAGEAPGSPDRYRACASEELVEAYHQMLALSRVARAEASAMLVVLDEREVWQADGCAGMAAWVAASESIRLCNARSVLEVARGLARLPHCGAAAGRGELSGDQAVEVVRIADAQSDERWAQVAPGCTPSTLARFSRRHERATDAEAEADDACRRLRWRNDASHKMLLISARLPADQGEELTKVISAMAEDAERPADGVYEAFEARAADALVALASAKAHDYADSPRTLVVMHVGADALRTGGDGFAQSEGGTALAPEVARRIACDARLQIVIEDAHGVALGVGRASRVAPAWLARLVGERDSHACRFPGCGRRRGTQIHHITHWADMGPTDLVNLCTLCHRHHHLVHEKGWSLTGDPNQPGGLRIARPGGAAFEPWATTLRPEVSEAVFGRTSPGSATGPPGDTGPPGSDTGPPPGVAGP